MEPSVAVVILNWNGKSFLERFLPRVVKSQYSNLQLVVADNASTDQSVEFVNAQYPQIQTIALAENFGFAEGYNKALSLINADYFVLLNSDVEVPENWIRPVIDLMQSDSGIAAAQPKIKAYHNKASFEYAGAAGGFIDSYGFTFCRGRLFTTVETDQNQYHTSTPIFWASGAALFIKRQAWQQVNGLDGSLFAHMEEIDLCWRLKNLGHKIMYCPNAEVYHVGGGTLNVGSPFKSYLNFRNNLIIMQKNLPFKEACVKIFFRLWIDLAAWFQFALKGQFAMAFSINKAHAHFFARFFETVKKRSSHLRPLNTHDGVYRGSVVFQYFALGKKHFNQIFNK